MTFWVAGAMVVGSVAGAAISSDAARSAAKTQAGAANNALGFQENMYNQTVGNESQWLQAGQGASSQLNYLMGVGTPGQNGTGSSSVNGKFGSLNKPFTGDMMKQYSPAYQFQLQQGQQGTLNQSAGSQGAESGAALKDLTSFNQNYANTAFNNAFNQYQTQQSNVFNRLSGISQMGQGAASNQATGGSNYASGIGQSATNVGTALAAGQIGSANAYAGAINNSAPWLYAGMGSGGGSTALTYNAQPGMSTANQGLTATDSSGNLVAYTGSDWFLKKNVEPYLFYGQIPLYKFHYKDEDDTERKHVGVIAQEVLEHRPDTVKRGEDGYLRVNYRKLGIPTDEDWIELERISNA